MPTEPETTVAPPVFAQTDESGEASHEARATKEQSAAASPVAARPSARAAGAEPQPYDFRQSAFISAGELRRLRLQHEDFVRSLAAQLSIHLRLEFSLELSRVQTLPFRQFTTSLANPTHLSLFKIEPLRGIGVLEFQPRLALAVADRLLGGPGIPLNPDRELSEIEVALLDQVVELILREWCDQWARFQELTPALIGHETAGAYLHTSPDDAVLCLVSMEGRIADSGGALQLAFPFTTLEGLIRHLRQAVEAETHEAARRPAAEYKWNPLFDDVPLALTAELGSLELSAREVARLQVGDVLELDPACAHHVRVCVDSVPKFQGRLGTVGNKWAVELTGPVGASPTIAGRAASGAARPPTAPKPGAVLAGSSPSPAASASPRPD
jgi:flagellar motor switch protein FliM